MVKGWDAGKLQEWGDALFLAFFQKYPEEQKRFPKFANVSNLSGNAAFQAQSLAVLQFLNSMIGGDPVALFKAKVADHAGRNVPKSSYVKILDLMPGFFAARGGDAGEWNALVGQLKGAL